MEWKLVFRQEKGAELEKPFEEVTLEALKSIKVLEHATHVQ